MRVLYRAGRRRRRVMLFGFVTLAFAGVMGWLAYDALLHFGLSEGDGGALRPAGERTLVAVVIAVIAVAPAVGMWVYARRYVAEIRGDPSTRACEILPFVGPTLRLAAGEALAVGRHGDREWIGRHEVDAPWVTLQLRSGRRLIVDMKGEIVDADALRAVFEEGREESRIGRTRPGG